MIKDIIIALLGAALIQRPFWSLATGMWEIAVTYLMTFVPILMIITGIDECLQGKENDPRSGNSQSQ